MATMTRARLGPADHGQPLTYEEFLAGDYETGFRYELIDGRLYVSPEPNFSEDRVIFWFFGSLLRYHFDHPEVINYVSQKARVFVTARDDTTCPEPDVTAYANVPLDLPAKQVNWQDLGPILVVEVMTTDVWKDLRRNVELYFQVPSMREYWVLDASKEPDQPTLIQHRRHGKRWVVREYPHGSTFTTKLLPGFKLTIDPRQSR